MSALLGTNVEWLPDPPKCSICKRSGTELQNVELTDGELLIGMGANEIDELKVCVNKKACREAQAKRLERLAETLRRA